MSEILFRLASLDPVAMMASSYLCSTKGLSSDLVIVPSQACYSVNKSSQLIAPLL